MADISPNMRSGAIMLAGGDTPAKVAETLGVKPATVKEWLRRDDFLSLLAASSDQIIRAAAPMAQQVLIRQLADGNAWVAQSAAREVLRQAQIASGAAAASVQVMFAAMPSPGLPASEGE